LLSEEEGAEFADVRDLSDETRDSLEDFAIEFRSGTKIITGVYTSKLVRARRL